MTSGHHDRDRLDRALAAMGRQDPPAASDVAKMERQLRSTLSAPAIPGPSRVRRAVAAATAAAVVLTAWIAVAWLSPSPAVAALSELAAAAEVAQGPVVSEGRVEYVRFRSTVLVSVPVEGRVNLAYLLPAEVERWTTTDGIQRSDVTTGEPIFLHPEDRAVYEAEGLAEIDGVGQTSSRTVTGIVDPAMEFDWSLDPASLIAQIREVGPPEDVEVAETLVDLIRTTTASPELRAAALRALAELDIELVSATEDRWEFRFVNDVEGDAATAIEFTLDGTGTLRAERRVLVEAMPQIGLDAGTLFQDSEYFETASVAEVGDRP